MCCYIVCARRKNDGTELYLSRDIETGYPYFGISESSARQYQTEEEAMDAFRSEYEHLMSGYVDAKNFCIKRMSTEVVKEFTIDDDLLKQVRRTAALNKLSDEDKEVLGLA